MVDMSINFQKLYHFEGVGFKRWQKRMHFVLVTFKVVYVLSTPKPLDQSHWRKRMNLLRYSQKAEMGERRLFVYSESSKELWDSLESKYMTEDGSSKKFLAKLDNTIKLDDTFAIACIIDKFPPSSKDMKRSLKHKDELTLTQLGVDLRIEEEGQTSGTQYAKKYPGKFSRASIFKKQNMNKSVVCWECGGHHFKRHCRVWKKKKASSQIQHKSTHNKQNNGKGALLVTDLETTFVAMITEIYVVQDDNSWWIDNGVT
nr:zinc finger, CCHC-type [Ipomoea batatas]